MKNYKIYTFITILSLFFYACSSDDDSGLDNQAPSIEIHEPTTDQVFELGSELHLDIELEDNVELASYKVEVHNNFDGHTHDRSSNVTNASEPWSYSQTFEIEAGKTSYSVLEMIAIPADVLEGEYHLEIFAIDTAGNQSEAVAEFILGEVHSGEEHITIQNIMIDNVAAGGTLHPHADVEAEHGIQSISINIHGEDVTPTGGQVEWDFDETYTTYSGTSVEFHESIPVPANAAPGEYHVTIVVVDLDGNSHAEGAHFDIL
ncbi:DUF4625 domain-containing protein [Mesonia sp. K7]|uniref:DUF4625 domain-containing protein n=1 Tax=Mesonia sp. K7 TaxID=2218606 RepID=UPI000DA8AAA7|nr:DUF4625 domain-containing protein [Mesonia sp. K7]PZD77393.1 hypothetical protein DNG35_08730 [Mesonia sp. K7]